MRFIAGAKQPPLAEYDADVVMLSQARVAETLASIASVLGQSDVTWHLTILDQGSSAECLTTIAGLVSDHPNATLLALPRNLGVAAGRNRAVAFGHGRVVIGLDNDAVLPTNTILAAAVEALDADPRLAAIGFRILLASTGTDDILSWGYPRRLLPRAAESFAATTFVGAGHAIRRAAWDDVGGYDEALFFCWEEWDFCLRAIARGWRIAYRGDIPIHHMVSPERRVGWARGRWFYFVRNRLYLARKHGGSWLLVLVLASAYAIKGVRNGLAGDSLRAITAAMWLTALLRPGAPSHVLQAYLHSHDTAHRGRLTGRVKNELLSRLPG
jgi:GT2 family glycosyltransferase